MRVGTAELFASAGKWLPDGKGLLSPLDFITFQTKMEQIGVRSPNNTYFFRLLVPVSIGLIDEN